MNNFFSLWAGRRLTENSSLVFPTVSVMAFRGIRCIRNVTGEDQEIDRMAF